jgi:hypothetical protein
MAAAARAKIYAAEMAQKVTNEALQLFGANGYGRELPLERMVRDARMFTIGGGTAEILRNQLAPSGVGPRAASGGVTPPRCGGNDERCLHDASTSPQTPGIAPLR